MTKDEELKDAYAKLDAAEMQITRMRIEARRQEKVFLILEAAGFITRDKISEALNILDGLPNED